MKYNRSLPVLILAYLVALGESQQDPECTPCFSGQEPFDDEAVCENTIELVKEEFGGTPECQALQLATYQGSCCDSPPEGFCTLCETFNADKVVPNPPRTAQNAVVTCQNIADRNLYVRQPATIFGRCDLTERGRARAYCECAGFEPACELTCDDGNPPPDLDKADPVFGKTCARLMYEYNLLTAEECQDPTISLNFDAKAFCCNEPEPDNCSICPEGTKLDDPDTQLRTEFFGNATCGEIDTYASFLPDDSCILFVRDLLDDPFDGELQCCISGARGQVTALLVTLSVTLFSAASFL